MFTLTNAKYRFRWSDRMRVFLTHLLHVYDVDPPAEGGGFALRLAWYAILRAFPRSFRFLLYKSESVPSFAATSSHSCISLVVSYSCGFDQCPVLASFLSVDSSLLLNVRLASSSSFNFNLRSRMKALWFSRSVLTASNSLLTDCNSDLWVSNSILTDASSFSFSRWTSVCCSMMILSTRISSSRWSRTRLNECKRRV